MPLTSIPDEFKRTVCACQQCTACCKRQPGPLAPGDFERIQAHLGASDDEMRKLFVASPGSMVKDSLGDVFRVGTITPRYRKGRCVFLNEQDRCEIHAVAPFGCAYFDTHMGWMRGQQLSSWLAGEQHKSEAYKQLRDTLPYTNHHKPNRYTL